jgi:putative endonuclease
LLQSRMAGGWVYFMTNRRDGVLYAGVTSNLPKRAHEHREGLVDGFTKEHGLSDWSTTNGMTRFN